MKIVAVEPLGISKERFEELEAEFARQGHLFKYYTDRREDVETMVQRMHDADIVIVSNIPLPEEVLSQCVKLKMLSVAFTGLDHIDLGYCKSHDIEVANAAGYSTTAVSELAVGLMLDVLRHVTALDGAIRQGLGRGNFLGRELRGKTVGVVGTGAIGTAVIKLLLAFKSKVIAYNRSEHEDIKQLGVQYVDLASLVMESDIVTVHVPLTQETHHLLSKELIATMRPTAVLVNTARGNVVDMEALATALKEGRLAGAGIDVYDKEPPLPEEHLLLQAPNCVCAPHVGFATREAFDVRADIVFDHVRQFLSTNTTS
ncbi:MAG: NAD(P)-dependent oxidoreductase [Bacteroidales bacterium]|nr:NAD(P)-dependent oxidoreductase [Bacteroidales bacterium]